MKKSVIIPLFLLIAGCGLAFGQIDNYNLNCPSGAACAQAPCGMDNGAACSQHKPKRVAPRIAAPPMPLTQMASGAESSITNMSK